MTIRAALLCIAVLSLGCSPRDSKAPSAESAAASDSLAALEVVTHFGERLKEVSLLSPDSLRSRQMREVYGPLVTTDLLERWIAHPERAPGRQVSSPWPERIDITAVQKIAPDHYEVDGEIVYVTSTGESTRENVVIEVEKTGDAWRIRSYEQGPIEAD